MRVANIFCIAFAAFLAASCGGGSVEGLEPEMLEVEGGTFSFGSMPDKTLVKGADGPKQLIMSSYKISSEPVSTALWDAVMGTKLSDETEAPVNGVSAKDCDKFVARLSKMTGKKYILPSEQMWEYACRKGVISPVSGTFEWCSDYFDASNVDRTVRSSKERKGIPEYTKSKIVLVRLAIDEGNPCDQKIVDAINGVQTSRERVCNTETIELNGVKFEMVAVKGSSALLGGTSEQDQYAEEDELPPYTANVEDFEIGQTEVTVAQWMAVMPVLPAGNYAIEPDKPVINVSWYAAQEFILRLNELTGRIFRLPTEAEWEYAARGGIKTSGYRYAGSNQIVTVAVHEKNSDNHKVGKVKSLGRNELGLYDMCGNAWEWCLDSYARYGEAAENPEVKVMRGGSAASRWNACRVSNRSAVPADNLKGTFGFRLAI